MTEGGELWEQTQGGAAGSLYLIYLLNYFHFYSNLSVQFSSVVQLCPILCDPVKSQHTRPPCLALKKLTISTCHLFKN